MKVSIFPSWLHVTMQTAIAGHMYTKKADEGKCPKLSILGRENVQGNMSRGESPTSE